MRSSNPSLSFPESFDADAFLGLDQFAILVSFPESFDADASLDSIMLKSVTDMEEERTYPNFVLRYQLPPWDGPVWEVVSLF